MEVVVFILCIVAFAAVMSALSLLIETQRMTDEERKELGLGPKGQGRR